MPIYRPPPNPQYDDSVLFQSQAYSRGSIEGWLMKVHHAYLPGAQLYDDVHRPVVRSVRTDQG